MRKLATHYAVPLKLLFRGLKCPSFIHCTLLFSQVFSVALFSLSDLLPSIFGLFQVVSDGIMKAVAILLFTSILGVSSCFDTQMFQNTFDGPSTIIKHPNS